MCHREEKTHHIQPQQPQLLSIWQLRLSLVIERPIYLLFFFLHTHTFTQKEIFVEIFVLTGKRSRRQFSAKQLKIRHSILYTQTNIKTLFFSPTQSPTAVAYLATRISIGISTTTESLSNLNT